jgi:hypothetical protein
VERVREEWPALPLEGWRDTKETLHRWCQVVGKVRMALTPPRNHWWHVTLLPSTRGFTTGPMHCGGSRRAEIELDLVAHRRVVRAGDGASRERALSDGLSVAAFHDSLADDLAALGVAVKIDPRPFDLGDSPRFPEDAGHASYDAAAVERWWTMLRQVEGALSRFAGGFVGKTSPVQLFWHSFDLAMTRFSGRRAPGRDGLDPVSAEAYSHEVVSFGVWAGDDRIPAPALYSYTAPEPEGLTGHPLAPAAARWQTGPTGSLALLLWEDVRTAPDPETAMAEFLESAYRAGASAAGWDPDLEAR